MKQLWWIVICISLVGLIACQDAAYNPKNIENCKGQCKVDADCFIISENCFLHSGNSHDAQCFWDEYEKFKTSDLAKSIKCVSPRPATDYNVVCVQNQCQIKDLKPTKTAKLKDDASNPRQAKIAAPEVSTVTKFPPLYIDSKWQFADYTDPDIKTLGPDYQPSDKPFIAFSQNWDMME